MATEVASSAPPTTQVVTTGTLSYFVERYRKIDCNRGRLYCRKNLYWRQAFSDAMSFPLDMVMVIQYNHAFQTICLRELSWISFH